MLVKNLIPAFALFMGQMALAATVTVHVAPGGQLAFSPNDVQANPGDTVMFTWDTAGHSVTQTTFDNPCGGGGGFNAGIMTTSGATFNVMINDTSPIFVQCIVDGHCAAGMVMTINANDSSSQSFAAFQAKAEGKAAPSASASGSASASASGSAAATSKAASASASATSGGGSNPYGGSSSAATKLAAPESVAGMLFVVTALLAGVTL
ncbi:hypothetical protein JCM24511_06969 [Saitozyma sp. JCM 24511]|nr:hypothetical protein JCM24511_06969 [Saitozyma sp. JCM 24511]